MSLRNYRLRKKCSCKCLKSYVSEHLRTVNMLKSPKRCCNLQDSPFIIFVHYSGKAPAGKSLSY